MLAPTEGTLPENKKKKTFKSLKKSKYTSFSLSVFNGYQQEESECSSWRRLVHFVSGWIYAFENIATAEYDKEINGDIHNVTQLAGIN